MHTRENWVEAGGAVPGGGGAVPGVTGLQVQGGCTQAWLPALRLPSGSQLLPSGTTVSWLLVQVGSEESFYIFLSVCEELSSNAGNRDVSGVRTSERKWIAPAMPSKSE